MAFHFFNAAHSAKQALCVSATPAHALGQYLLHVGVAHGLRNPLAFIVAGSGAYRVHVAPVFLALRVNFRVYEEKRNRVFIPPCFKFIPMMNTDDL